MAPLRLLVTLLLLVPSTVTASWVVVAVDTSRSLQPAEIERARERLETTLLELPRGSSSGLMAFDDQTRWLQPPGSTPAEVVAALADLAPAGRYTLLNDALFVAAREMPSGGVLLLLTDGRDENSATTVEDVARLCRDRGVSVVAVSMGRVVDERALRRLALLTDGRYLGRLGDLEPGDLASAVSAAAGPTAAPATPEPLPPPDPSPAVEAATEEHPEEVRPRWLAPAMAVAAVVAMGALVALAVLIVRRRRRAERRLCEDCGAELEPWETTCSACAAQRQDERGAAADEPGVDDTVVDRPVVPPAADATVPDPASTQPVAEEPVDAEDVLDPTVFAKAPLDERLEQTLVLDEQPVLVARQPGQPTRTYMLPREQVFAVGRAPQVNTLQVTDPTVSGQHFKLVPSNGDYFVVDLETTNGTLVNGRPIRAHRLDRGDVIRVGTLEFVFELRLQRRG